MGLGDVFGEGSTAEQFLIWGVLQQLLQPLLAPVVTELQKLVFSATPDVPLSPNAAAELVARGLLDDGSGQDKANDNGIGEGDYHLLVQAAATAPALAAVLELYRRGLIEAGGDDPQTPSVGGALADQGLRQPWRDLVTQLAVAVPDPAQVLTAWLEGQIDEGTARPLLVKGGMDPDWIQTAYNASGQAPTPSEALELLNRGIIAQSGTGPDSTSYEQAFLEGPWRNKWLTPFLALAQYLPPPRTITAMFHDGQLTHDQAAGYLAQQGLDATLVAAYLAPAATSLTSHDKALTKTDLTAAYADGLLSRGQATDALTKIGYTGADAGTILDLVDVRTATAQVSAGVTRARALFDAGKLTEAQAKATLQALGMTAAQAAAVVDTWAITAATATRVLSAAQIEAAYYYNLLTSTDAIGLLQALGYDEFDAWVILANRVHGPLQDYPRPHSPYQPPPPPPPPPTP